MSKITVCPPHFCRKNLIMTLNHPALHDIPTFMDWDNDSQRKIAMNSEPCPKKTEETASANE